MFCLLDVIAWPIFLVGGSVVFLIVAGILLCVSTVVLMIVTWSRHQKKSKTETAPKDMEEA